jgi:alkylated DNA repair dioxygenase AlkB
VAFLQRKSERQSEMLGALMRGLTTQGTRHRRLWRRGRHSRATPAELEAIGERGGLDETYDFDTGVLRRGDPLPGWLLPFRDRAADFAGLPPADLVQALLIRYDPGAGIGWHKDRPTFEHVIGLSLGSPAAMRFRRRRGERFERATVPLEPRGTYHLSGEARHEWEHSIAELDQTRWSVTFRSMSDRAA